MESRALEVRHLPDQALVVRERLSAEIAAIASDFGLVPVSMPHGSHDPPPTLAVEYVCAFKSVEEVGAFSILLWVETRQERIFARIQRYHPGWSSCSDTRALWERLKADLATELGDDAIPVEPPPDE
jgi:hypothetical protein